MATSTQPPANGRVGFIGLGIMGTPMAQNLCRKFPTTVWNRTASKCEPLAAMGATVAESPAAVAAQSDVIFMMLYNGEATRAILTDDFSKALQGKTVVSTSSIEVSSSEHLGEFVHNAKGNYIEMPVSGSKVPAEQGNLVGMMGGDREVAESIRPYLDVITKKAIYCGPVGAGLKAKFAINTFLLSVTAGLAESMNLAKKQGLDLEAFSEVVGASPMASVYSTLKADKIFREDWSAQAAMSDCCNNAQLILAASKAAGAWSPLIEVCGSLYKEGVADGIGHQDMIAVSRVISGDSKKDKNGEQTNDPAPN